ncbi:pectate lyase 1-like [Rutidosis leptorrhynchoides]|uniref:pectate lyase 1-like n=1 Tax=Rutidosis leptorrhynchoides TaxID=125765 RepID=UPI003A996B32
MRNIHLFVLFTLTFAIVEPSTSARAPDDDNTIADAVDHGGERSKQDNTAYNPELFSGKYAGDVEARVLFFHYVLQHFRPLRLTCDRHGNCHRSITEKNLTRRNLHECETKNTIDKCWRCKADWADNRKALADCVIGFAKGTTGGAAGDIYTVTCDSDDNANNPKEGTLRWAVCQPKPLWIIFERDMVINLKHSLHFTSDKTIDGRGAKVEITGGGGFTIHTVSNIIIHNLNIHDVKVTQGFSGKSGCDGDAIAVKSSSKVWIDHCSMSKGPDGLLDVTVGSTYVTISNCRFYNHDKVLLLGADDSHSEDKKMRVTVAYNRFDEGCVQRMPRCRFGFFQIVNNDYNKWGMYAIGGSANPTILSQGNKFLASDNKFTKRVTQRSTTASEQEWKNWNWRTDSNDVFENGAFFVASGSDPTLTPEQQQGMIPAEPGSSVPQLTSCAGVLSCVAGQPSKDLSLKLIFMHKRLYIQLVEVQLFVVEGGLANSVMQVRSALLSVDLDDDVEVTSRDKTAEELEAERATADAKAAADAIAAEKGEGVIVSCSDSESGSEQTDTERTADDTTTADQQTSGSVDIIDKLTRRLAPNMSLPAAITNLMPLGTLEKVEEA